MRVRKHLRLQLGLIRGRRLLLMGAAAAVLVGIAPEHPRDMVERVWLFAAVLLSLWLLRVLVATLLGVPKPSPRCPHCAHKLILARGMTSCPTCQVSFDAKVQREWRRIHKTQSPWITRPESLRTGQR